MANLVRPINLLPPTEDRIIEFRGLNRRNTVADGEMADMWNLSSDDYPVLTPRRPRGEQQLPNGAVKPVQIMQRFERIAMIAQKADGSYAFFYNRTEVANVTGLTADSRMVAINTKICFFPQKTYVEIVRTGSVVTTGDFGHLDAQSTLTNAAINMSNENARLVMHSMVMASDYGYDDAIMINGTLSYTDSEGQTQSDKPCVVSCIIEEVAGNTLVLPRETFIEMTGEGATNIIFSGTVSRTMPDLDHVIEWNNRLWGVSNITNEIYACKLGDPKNWQYFQGTSLDSYSAQQGTDEDWTGCAAYSGHLIFFKQNSMAKIYGTAPSNFQLTNAQCYGVEQGSADSVVVLNDTVFYKSTIGIMAYTGSIPQCISENLNEKFSNVVAGTEGQKYYASIVNAAGENELMVFDMSRAIWHKEDDVRFRTCATMDGRLYFVCDQDTESFSADHMYVINPAEATESADSMEWRAVFGPFDEYVEHKKIYSKLWLRLIRNAASTVKVYISLDEGPWEQVYSFDPTKTGGDYIPIVPRRCDRYSVKIEGVGNCEIKSLTRKVRAGTGGRL